jgi:hypothetical protein
MARMQRFHRLCFTSAPKSSPVERRERAKQITFTKSSPRTVVSYHEAPYGGERAKVALYLSLAAFAEATGHERHGIMVDYGMFPEAVPPRVGMSSEPSHCDLRLRAGTALADAGTALPNINEASVGLSAVTRTKNSLPVRQFAPAQY